MSPAFGQVMRQDDDVEVNGQTYRVVAHQSEYVPIQPGDDVSEWERRIENWALGWGFSQFVRPGTYDYASAANLHQVGRFRPGAAITTAAALTGNVSFVEYWDAADTSARRLIAVAARQVSEVNAAGTVTTTSLTAIVDASARMMKGIRFRAPSMASPKVFIPVHGALSTDHFITRTAANTYIKNTGGKRAFALAAGRDIDGADIVWRIDENGRLNATTEDSDPNTGASWAGASYGTGEVSVRANDLFQVGRTLYIGRQDGAYAFDMGLNSIPITRGMEQTPDPENFTWFKENQGLILAPTAQGIIWIEGLDWGVVGPVSSNEDARNLRGVEQSVCGSAGAFVYASVYFGGTSYIFVGTARREGESGDGPYTWHGPVASIAQQLTDMIVSTVTGDARLWVGWNGGFGSMRLNDDFSPKSDVVSGYIYLPEGIFDMEGAGVVKDFRKVEFLAPASKPFSATNQWTLELETTPGSGTYVAVNGGNAASGVVAERFWTTPTSGTRIRGRLAYASNSAGTAELEAVIVRGTHRPEKAKLHKLQLRFRDAQHTRRGRQVYRSAIDRVQELEALRDSAGVTTVLYGEVSFTARVVGVVEATNRIGHTRPPERIIELTLKEMVLA